MKEVLPGWVTLLVLRQVLVVTPTADGNSVDVDYALSDARLDAWAQRHGVPPVRALLQGWHVCCDPAASGLARCAQS